jgi:hypothetical protein
MPIRSETKFPTLASWGGNAIYPSNKSDKLYETTTRIPIIWRQTEGLYHQKEQWYQYTCDSVAWRDYEIAYKRLSKNRQVNISKACFNLWHTGRKNGRYYGGRKSCFLCNALEEDWIHILACPLIDACMNGEELWAKAQKAMSHWKLPNDFLIAMEKGLNGYTRAPDGGNIALHFPLT